MLFDTDADSSLPILRVKWECVGDERQILRCPTENVSPSQCNMKTLGGVHCFGEMK